MSLNHLDRLNERFTDVYNQIQSTLKDTLSNALKELFDKYPDLEVIGWVQYRPFFNDGDPCTFSVHDVHYLNKEDVEDKDRLDDIYEWNSTWRDRGIPMHQDLDKLNRALNTFEDMLEGLFGDAKIKAWRGKDELEVECYENHE